MSISYFSFIQDYPVYAQPPYIQSVIERELKQIAIEFPSIESCLPPDARVLATYFAKRYIDESEDCQTPVPIKEIATRNDTVKFALAGNGNILGNTVWGSRLNKLFKTYGCFHYSPKSSYDDCHTQCACSDNTPISILKTDYAQQPNLTPPPPPPPVF
jgi:hypothetical protein